MSGERLQLRAGEDTFELSRFGAQPLRWCSGGRDWLYLSPRAALDGRSAIRGGVPIIFPQFAERGGGPRHGFARTRPWQILEHGERHLRLALADDDATRAAWPHRFRLEFTATLAPGTLDLLLVVENRDAREFAFAAALHAYFALAFDRCGIEGLESAGFEEGGRRHAAAQRALEPRGALDRIYAGGSDALRLCDGDQALTLQREGFYAWVVWNPGSDAAAALGDLGSGEEQRFVCIEPACALEPVNLGPGERWQGRLRLQVESALGA